ncbi:hypothetical protein [Hydrogenimonas cancrithermarum]|uniref:Uncharacterized protein n=1 Tax=Hydrogenimonas cancrithermarum TaxID=2993563 RepID=A0ABM8FPN3_9BACT|nr:hypothetical protein [Hydrogenimonas cancrithermarum]BDY13747.1 hypothetical protein HCR_20590 [Hydrogenimonas cancrithermarum]
MSNLTQSEREGLNELFCHLEVANLPFYKRLLLRLNHLVILMKMYLLH